MRLMIIGSLNGDLSAATKIAMDRGARVTHASTTEMALKDLRSGRGADLIMIEVMYDIGEFIANLEVEHIHVPIVACGTDHDARAAVQAIQAGAKEYIPLPPDAEHISAVLEAISTEAHALIFRDEKMADVVALADQISSSDASILITGESGTGKEVMAKYVHQKSSRADKVFISVNCAAIPDNLIESELFGHEKGAFTGAVARRIGKFEEADGGTLLLDEISEIDVRLQAKLLRALQERIIDRIGSSKPVAVNIRIIATSNRDLKSAVQDGSFREDLLYRLNVVNLHLPPLRKRPQDILELANHFIRKYSEENGLPYRPINQDARRQILSHPWPGNVRELENTMHRSVLLASGEAITPEAIRAPNANLGEGLSGGARSSDAAEDHHMAGRSMIGKTVAEVERDLILETLDHYLGNRTHAANILGISIRTLRNKLKQYSSDGTDVPEPRESRPYIS